LHERLRAAAIRSHLDERNETLNYRVRDGEMAKVPYIAVVGGREAEHGTVAVRAHGTGNKQDVMAQDAFIAQLTENIRTRARVP
jgi:threonyl-tRNA synthetase